MLNLQLMLDCGFELAIALDFVDATQKLYRNSWRGNITLYDRYNVYIEWISVDKLEWTCDPLHKIPVQL